MRRSRRAALCLVVLLASASPVFASGGSDCQELNCSTFFSPWIIQSPYESALFRSTRSIRGTPDQTVQIEAVNLKEWSEYFDNAIPQEFLSTLVYRLSLEDLRSLRSSLAQGASSQNTSMSVLRAELVKYRNRDRILRSLQYLELAKSVEPLALRNLDQGWVYPPRPKPVITVNTEELIAEANLRIPSVDRFLAGRYRFQIMRLLYYTGQFAEAVKYYERFGSTFKDESSVRYRFMDLAGGAYGRERKLGKANYLFSLVFDRFPLLKASAYFSFSPLEDVDWKETLKLARNNHEKEVLWQLLGIKADGMSAIDNIYAINPKSKLLPLLLVREVNLVEARWTSNQYQLHAEGGRPASDRNVVGQKRLDRIRTIANAGKVYKPYLWLVATGHLLALAGDTVEADAYFQRAMKSAPEDPEVRAQLRASALFARVRSIKAIDQSAEAFFARELEWLRRYAADQAHSEARNMEAWALGRLSDVYKEGGDRARSLMLGNSWQSEIYQSPAAVDEILDLIHNAKTDFDRFLLVNYKHTEANTQELRAIHFIFSGDFEKALERLRLAGSQAASDPLDADPFVIHIRDCHSCDATATLTTYTKASFVERMLSLSRTAQGKDQTAANASFELANGFYNMSYYGNNRGMTHLTHLGISSYRPKNDSFATLNMDMAEKYYSQAANLSADREFKAKALFMAAKAEQNRNYNMGGGEKVANPRKYFALLRDSFADTQYYEEIIRECGQFKWFTDR